MHYATAMDVFIILCFFSVFMALVEFALINFIDTLVKNRKRKELEKQERAKQRVEKAKVKRGKLNLHCTTSTCYVIYRLYQLVGAPPPGHVGRASGGRCRGTGCQRNTSKIYVESKALLYV